MSDRALIHKLDGDFIGAFVYKNNEPNGEVQPITVRKINIPKYFDKFLKQIPVTYNGKPPIGSIEKNFHETEKVFQLGENLEEGSYDNIRIYPKDVPKDLSVHSNISKEDIENLTDLFTSADHVDFLSRYYGNNVEKAQEKYTGDKTNRGDFKKIVELAHIAKSQWGPQWADKLHHALSKKPKAKEISDLQKPVQTSASAKKKEELFKQVKDQVDQKASRSELDKYFTNLPAFAQTDSQEKEQSTFSADKDNHYHANDKKIDFSSDDINAALKTLDNNSPYNIVLKAPQLNTTFKQKFGSNWAPLLSVAQRITRYKTKGIPDPVAKVKSEYKDSLVNLFGADWETNFNKIADKISPDTMITQADSAIDKKEKNIEQLQANYTFNQKEYNPDLKYLKDIAVPALLDKSDGHLITLDETDPALTQDLYTNLGPNWRTLVSIAKNSLRQDVSKQDPYLSLLDSINKNKTMEASFTKKLGPNYLQSLFSVIQAITGIKPKSEILQSLQQGQEQQAQAGQVDPNQQQGIDPNSPESQQAAMQQQITQNSNAAAQDQQDPNAELQAQSDPNVVATDPQQAVQDPSTQSDSNATAQAQPAQGEIQPDGITDADLPSNDKPTTVTSTPIEGDGSVPQTHHDLKQNTDQGSNIFTNEPSENKPENNPVDSVAIPDNTGVIKYINNGVLNSINNDQIKQALAIDIFAPNNPQAKDQIKQSLGRDWESLYAHIHMASELLKAGKDPETEWKKDYSDPDEQKKIKRKLGPNWERILSAISQQVNVLKNELSQQQ